MIFCKLKGGSGNTRTRTTPTRRPTLAPDPVLDDFQLPGSESLIKAVLNGHIEDAKAMIKDGADVNEEDVHGNSVLHIAAQNGRVEVIDDLLLKGADVNK